MSEIKTSIVDTSDFWRRVLAGERVPADINDPQPGYWKRRFVKGGPFLPARVWIEEERDETGDLMADQRLRCIVDGRECDPLDHWVSLAGHAITKDDYDYMTADAEWCHRYKPTEPKANPLAPIDLRTTAPVAPPGRNQ